MLADACLHRYNGRSQHSLPPALPRRAPSVQGLGSGLTQHVLRRHGVLEHEDGGHDDDHPLDAVADRVRDGRDALEDRIADLRAAVRLPRESVRACGTRLGGSGAAARLPTVAAPASRVRITLRLSLPPKRRAPLACWYVWNMKPAAAALSSRFWGSATP